MELRRDVHSQLLQLVPVGSSKPLVLILKLVITQVLGFFFLTFELLILLCLSSKFSFLMDYNLFLQIYKWIEHLGD